MTTAAERYKSLLFTENLYTVNGRWYPGPPEKHDKIRELPIHADDTVLVCYPKSGTHWLYRIVTFLNTDGDLDKVHHYPFIPMEVSPKHAPNASLELIAAAPSPRILCTHLPFELCPKGVQEGGCKRILVIRNPKDVAVSLFHFQKKLKSVGDFENLTWEDFLEVFCEPDILFYGSWFENVKNWLEHRNDPNVLVVMYEDLKKDLANGVFKIAEFMGRPVTGDRVAEIAKKCQYDNMRKDVASEDKQGGIGLGIFLRKGVVGDWKSHFTVAQNEMFDKVYKREMKDEQLPIQFES